MEKHAPEVYKTHLEKEFEEDQEKEKQYDGVTQGEQELSLLERALQIPKEDRRLDIKNYLEFICDDLYSENPIYIPVNTVTPSELEGFTLEEERNFRVYGCELIQEAGILLKLPMVTMATGQAILHRFFYRKSFIRCEVLTVATASLFLAAKIEENPRKIKDLVSVFDYVHKMKKGTKRPIPVLDLNSFQFTDSKSETVDAERFILKELGFSTDKIQTSNVHKYIYFYLRTLEGSKQLAQKSWNFVNDCYRTISVVCFPPNVVACSCIYLAARSIDYPLPNLEWWKIFGVIFEDIQYVCSSIIELYQMEGEKGSKCISTQYIESVIKKISDQKQREIEIHIKQLMEEGKYERPTKWANNELQQPDQKQLPDDDSTPEPQKEPEPQPAIVEEKQKDNNNQASRKRSTSRRGRNDSHRNYKDRHHHRRYDSRDRKRRHHDYKRRRRSSSSSYSDDDKNRHKKKSKRSRSKEDKRKKDYKRKRSRSRDSSKSSSLD